MADKDIKDIKDDDLENMSKDDLLATSRALESRANVLRSRAAPNDDDDRGRERLSRVGADLRKVQDRIRQIDEEEHPKDLEGTAPSLSDSEGNFAGGAEVAGSGGISVKASNTPGQERVVPVGGRAGPGGVVAGTTLPADTEAADETPTKSTSGASGRGTSPPSKK